MRWGFNWFPAYRRTGGRVTYLSGDLHEIHVKLPLNRQTRNYVGTIFGGSIYAAVDPLHMFLFIQLLGRGYIVWDKAATVRFKRPGRSTLMAKVRIEPSELEAVRARLDTEPKFDRTYSIELLDAGGTVCAEVEKVIHFRRKTPGNGTP